MLRDKVAGLLCNLPVAAEAGEPVECGIFAEPCELAFGVVAVALLGGGDGLVSGKFAAQESGGLGVAERGQWTAIRAVACDELGGLFDEATSVVWRVEHLGGAVVDAGIEFGAGRVEAESQDVEAGERIARLLPLAGDGPAGGERNLNGADDLGRVVGMDQLCRGGVEMAEDAVQVHWATELGALAELIAQGLELRWCGEETVDERAQVKAGSAADDGQAAAHDDSTDGLAGEAAVIPGGARSIRRKDVDEVMRDAGAFSYRWLGGTDLHATIDGD